MESPNSPCPESVAPSGDIFFADSENHRIRKITRSGEVTTFAGSGHAASVDGSGLSAQFKFPWGLEMDATGNLFVSEHSGNRIRKISPDGMVTTIAGSGAHGFADSKANSATFDLPVDLAIDESNNILYVVDQANHAIRKINLALDPSDNGFVSTLAGGVSGFQDGTGSEAKFSSPRGIELDGEGNLFVADTSNRRIRKVTSEGVVTTIAGDGQSGTQDGQGTSAQFTSPTGLFLDGDKLYCVQSNGATRLIDFSNGNQVTTLGQNNNYGIAMQNGDLLLSSQGYIKRLQLPGPLRIQDADTDTLTVHLSVGNGSLSVTLSGGTSFSAGANDTANLSIQGQEAGLEATLATLVYNGNPDFWGEDTLEYSVSDGESSSLVKTSTITVNPINDATPVLSTIEDKSFPEDSELTITLSATDADGDPLVYHATGSTYIQAFIDGNSLLLSPSNNWNGTETISVTVTDNNGGTDTKQFIVTVNPVDDPPTMIGLREVVGKEDMAIPLVDQGYVSTYAGGEHGFEDGPLAEAKFGSMFGIVPDSKGNLFVVDNSQHRIIKISQDGNVSTFAGDGTQGHADGIGTDAKFTDPTGLAIDGFDNLYVSSRGYIRKITPEGLVTTLAGNGQAAGGGGTAPIDGDGSSARMGWVYGMVYDQSRNLLYFTDNDAHSIRKINLSLPGSDQGYVSTLAGQGAPGNLDGVGTNAGFDHPFGLVLDSSSNLYVADRGNHKIRKVSPAGEVSTIAGTGLQGLADGTGSSARFNSPMAMAINGDNLYVESGFYLRKVALTGDYQVSTQYGDGTYDGDYQDGSFAIARIFDNPSGMAVKDGYLFLTEGWGSSFIRKVDLPGPLVVNEFDEENLTIQLSVTKGTLSTTLSGSASINAGQNASSTLSIQGSEEDVNGSLASLVYQPETDFWGEATLTYSVSDGTTTSEEATASIFVQPQNDGAPVLASIGAQTMDEDTPLEITLAATDVDGDPLVYSASGTPRIQATVSGNVLTLLPARNWNGEDSITITVDDGNGGIDSETIILTVSPGNDAPTLRAISSLVAQEDTPLNIQNDAFVSTLDWFENPGDLHGVARDFSGNIFFPDARNNVIKKIDTDGTVSTWAGDGTEINKDGTGLSSGIRDPHILEIDAWDNLYAAVWTTSQQGYAGQIRKITPEGEVSTIAGSGFDDFKNGAGHETGIGNVISMALDRVHNFLYFVDISSPGLIRKIDLNLPFSSPGFVSDFVGSRKTGYADGVGAEAIFRVPWGMDVDSDGNLYAADENSIRKITPSGVVTTIAGSNESGNVDGQGTSAKFSGAGALKVWDDGTLYVGDVHYLKKIDLLDNNKVTTLFGQPSFQTVDGKFDTASLRQNVFPGDGFEKVGWNLIMLEENNLWRLVDFGGPLRVNDRDGDTLTIQLSAINGTLDMDLAGGAIVTEGGIETNAISIQGTEDDLNAILATLTYTGNTNFTGQGTLSYSVSDGVASSGNQTIQITVSPVNDGGPEFAPIQPLTIQEDSQGSLTLSATDPDGDTITYSSTGSQHITISLDGEQLTFTPDPNWFGTETITVTAEDGNGGTGILEIEVIIEPVDDVPHIEGITSVSGNEDTAIPVALVARELDGDTLVVDLSVAKGTISVNLEGEVTVKDGANGSKHLVLEGSLAGMNTTLALLSYLGDPDFWGQDVLSYSMSDGTSSTEPASMAIQVLPVNDGDPVLDPIGGLTTYQDVRIQLALSATDVDGSALTYSSNGSGNIAASVSGTELTLVPAAGWSGSEDVEVTVVDGQGGTDTETFTVTVLAVDAPEVDHPYTIFGSEGGAFAVRFGGEVANLAGSGFPGFSDGQGLDAKFWAPSGIDADSHGNLYVADSRNHCIRKIHPDGTVTTLTGYGSQTTEGFPTRLLEPRGIVVDDNGNIYVSQTGRHNIVKIAPDGSGVVLVGTGTAGDWDGDAGDSEFREPWGLALDAANQFLYVADRGNHSIRRIDLTLHPADSDMVVTLAGTGQPGYLDGDGGTAEFNYPTGLDVDADGNVYVADTLNHRIRKISTDVTVSTLAGDGLPGHVDNDGQQSRMYNPMDVIVYDAETLFTVEEGNFFRKVSLGGSNPVTTLFGNGEYSSINGDLRSATLNMPSGLATHGGKLFFTQTGDDAVRQAYLERPVSIKHSVDQDLEVLLAVGNGNLTVNFVGSASLIGGANGTHTLTLEGSGEDINSTLQSLQYEGAEGFWGMDFLMLAVSNGISDPVGKLVTIVVDPSEPDSDGDGIKDSDEPSNQQDPDTSPTDTSGGTYAPIVKTFQPELGYQLSGQIESDGGSEILEAGFRISSSNVFLGGMTTTFVATPASTGMFGYELMEFDGGGKHYVQAYATNAIGTSYGFPKEFIPTPPEHNLWENATPLGDSGWYDSAIGILFIKPGSKWIHHSDWGWLYVEGKSLADFWIWNPSNGWHWSSLDTYPYLYRENMEGWVYWMKDASFQTIVFNAVSGLYEEGL